ncbi:hypothetical protein BVH01_15990 [Pseudomonas sp. PA1(2017)]|uniref:pyocin knob domain-containing protein n=1 Tax=Pseudomonas sp. PA1(2017) TaxID=1932113 RepID=UPI000959AE4D|nr:pyocin knob domain-containing protein [Pseudomonas sp. PA1(2017)]OLU15319.1 hypothetical protein BVH01_15990 [Pseudomonas sp. PA1(2017)]
MTLVARVIALAQAVAADIKAIQASLAGLGTAARKSVTTSSVDLTADRVLRVGDGGWMGDVPVPNAPNLDDRTMRGWRYIGQASAGVKPPDTTYGHVLTFGNAGDAVTQEFWELTGEAGRTFRKFFRQTYGTGPWGPWAELGKGSSLVKETKYDQPGAISHVMHASTAVYEVEVWGGGGAGGSGAPPSGQASKFGAVTADGGKGGSSGYGGDGGEAFGGLLNIKGQAGDGVDSGGYGGAGGMSPRGGGGGRMGTSGIPGTPGAQPGGGGGSAINPSMTGGGAGYSFDRKLVGGGSTVTGMVGAGATAGSNGYRGGDGMIIVREYSSSVPGVETINQISAQVQALAPAVISGAIGTAFSGNPGLSAGAKIPFNEFWSNVGGITYDAATRRFYVPSAGVYRIQLSGLNTQGGSGNRVLVGINNDAPNNGNHMGVGYTPGVNAGLELITTVPVPAGGFIVFYLSQGSLNNFADNRLGQFSIERVTR